MSNPSFSNIDLWLFELAEGNLTPRQIEQLELFLLQNPELDIDRDTWEMAKVEKQVAIFPDQEKLNKRRPIAWYFAGAAAAVVASSLAWWAFTPGLFDPADSMLSARNSNRTETRVFVIHRTDASVAGNSPITAAFVNANELGFPTSVTAQHPLNGAHTAFNFAQSQINGTQSQVNGLANTINGLDQEDATMPTVANPEGLQISSSDPQISSLQEVQGSMEMIAVQFEQEKLSYASVNSLEIAQVYRLETTDGYDYEPNQSAQPFAHVDDEFKLVDGLDNIGDEAFKSNQNDRISFSSDYKNSLKARLNAFGRKIQRTLDNPVALKNFRDPTYHVPGMLPNDINFGAAGTMLSTRVQTLSRLQWYEQANQQLINQLAVDVYAYKLRGGIGVQIQHGMYKNGGVSVAQAAITYSPKFSISRTISFEPSLRFKMGNKTLANSKMAGVDRVEVDRGNDFAYYPESQPIGKMLWHHDLGAGVMVNTEWFFVGVQMDNFFRHQDNVYDVDIEDPKRAEFHYMATLGTDWVSRRENLSLSPYLVYQKNERLSEAWLGANFRWNWLTVGASVSSSFAPAASLGLKFEHFAMTYSADYTKSAMTGQSALSHQLTLRFVGKPSRFGKRLLNL